MILVKQKVRTSLTNLRKRKNIRRTRKTKRIKKENQKFKKQKFKKEMFINPLTEPIQLVILEIQSLQKLERNVNIRILFKIMKMEKIILQ